MVCALAEPVWLSVWVRGGQLGKVGDEHAHIFMCVCTRLRALLCRSEVDIECLSQELFTLGFDSGSLIEPGV